MIVLQSFSRRKCFETFCDLADFIESQVIKTSKTFLIGNKFFTPISVYWTLDLQEFVLFLQDNSSNEIGVYFYQIPEYDIFEILELIHTEEVLNISNLNFWAAHLFQLSDFVFRFIKYCCIPFWFIKLQILQNLLQYFLSHLNRRIR